MAGLPGKTVALGSPQSSVHQISQVQLADWMTEIEGLTGLSGFAFVRGSAGALSGLGADGDYALVVTTGAERGIYVKEVGTWQKTTALPLILTESLAADQAEADRILAQAAASAAEGDADDAAASATAAATSQSLADVARTQAQLAAVAAGATLYASIAAGEAGTVNGDVFLVSTEPGVQAYENSAGTGSFLGWLGEVLLDDVTALKAWSPAPADGTIIRTRKEGWSYEADSTLTTSDLVGSTVKLRVLSKGAPHFEAFGALPNDFGVDNKAAWDRAAAWGNSLRLDAAVYNFDTSIAIPPDFHIIGPIKAFSRLPSGYSETSDPAVFHFDGCDGITSTLGFANITNLRISGTAGGYIGLKVLAPDFNTRDVSIFGFTDGVGMWLEDNFRCHHDGINIQACGAGVVLVSVVNVVTFTNPVIENCAVGIYGPGNHHGLVFTGGTIEGNEKGKLSAEFPGTGVLTVTAQILTDLGVTQANIEGAVILAGAEAQFNGTYFEKNSLCHIYAGLDTNLRAIGCYFENALTLLGSNQVVPDHFIRGARARATVVESCFFQIIGSQSTPLFDINTDRYHRYGQNRYLSGGSIYTGDLYGNSLGSLRYSRDSTLRDANNLLIGHRAQATYIAPLTVSSSGGTTTLDVSERSVFVIGSLTENTTIAFSGVDAQTDGQLVELHVFQDATGGRTVSFPSSVRSAWTNSGNTANKKTCITLRYRTADLRWHQVGAQPAWHD